MGLIVDGGAITFLNMQIASLQAYTYFFLFVNNWAPVGGGTMANITEASWTGYARQQATSWGPASFDGTRAVMACNVLPVFGNTSGSDQHFYGVGLVYDDGINPEVMLWAENIGDTVVPDTGTYTTTPVISDVQEL